MPTTICEQCKKEFQYKSKGKVRRFCSTKCAYPNTFEIRTETNCPICGDIFIKIESNNKNIRRVTCGKQKCQKSRKNHPNYSHNIEVLCEGCGKSFLKTSGNFRRHTANGNISHYCSSSCKSEHQSHLFSKKRIEKLESAGIDITKFRICAKCDTPKLIDEFTNGTKLKHTCRNCLYKYQKQRWSDRKKWAVAYLGGKCVDCGYDKNWVAFDFHHRNPAEKEFEWGKLKLRSKNSIKNELDKCDLLCCICHRIRHTKDDDNL